MGKHMRNNKGFTLAEILMVSSVMVVVYSVSFSIHKPKVKNNDILMEIVCFFDKAKLNSIIKKEKTEVIIHNNFLTYSSDSHSDSIVLKGLVVCNKKSFSYNKNGNIYKASTLKFIINGFNYDFVFQVGSGCYEIR